MNNTRDLANAIEDRERQDDACAALRIKLEASDPSGRSDQDALDLYRSIVMWCAAMMDGEISLMAPLLHEKLGIKKEEFMRDVRQHRKAVALASERKEVPKDGPGQGKRMFFKEVEPYEIEVNGGNLLLEISDFVSRYVALPKGAADTISAWIIATWFRNEFYFAPILALLSPTKRTGKTTLFEIITPLVYRGFPTSGVGITSAVLFRLNEKSSPTFIIDEAEKLAKAKGDEDAKQLISLLNQGYRKGSQVLRCAPKSHEVETYNAFGFRAVAAIGKLWDTLQDRSLIIRMFRKEKSAKLDRFNGRRVELEAKTIVRKIARWAKDHSALASKAEEESPRPAWMNDRACDNWGPVFAVGKMADGDPLSEGCLDRLLAAAKAIEGEELEEGDRGELILLDIKTAFEEAGNPEHIETNILINILNETETSPWGDENSGKGLTAQGLAALLRRFKIKPRQSRVGEGRKIRGYWLADFEQSFERYCPVDVNAAGSESGQSGQVNYNNDLDDEKMGAKDIHNFENRDKNNIVNSCSSDTKSRCPESKMRESTLNPNIRSKSPEEIQLEVEP